MLFEQDIQTSVLVFVLTVFIQEQVRRSVDGWSGSVTTKISDSKQQAIDLKEQRSRTQDQCKVICRLMSKEEDQREIVCLKEITRVCVFYFVLFRTLCTISAKYVNLNHLHKETVFHGKV
uniref:Uncharacterized protein n=1 Tax=Opuntia streptacantha TaxID=393608 RepID=A0A7C9CWZ0_OPUST